MDSIFLTGPLGTQWNIGSWLEKDAGGIDYGAAGLVRQQLTQTTFVEGAQFAYESAAGARKMTFPLIVPSGGVAGLSLDAIEASLRQMVRPGGFVDMQPQGVPTAEMVRFDVLGGDVAHRDYSIDLQRVARRRYTLSLQTQPFGYWPTWITLASTLLNPLGGIVATIPAASIVGDAPAFVRLAVFDNSVQPTGPKTSPDFVAWSLAGRPGITPVQAATNGNVALSGATTPPDTSASWMIGAATPYVVRVNDAQRAAVFSSFARVVTFSLGPAYYGRHRVFGVFRHGGGNAGTLRALAAADDPSSSLPCPTGNPVATIPAVASLAGASYFGIYDLGEVSFPNPPQASAFGASAARLTLWIGGASDSSVASTILDIAGAILLPADGPNGVMPRGMVIPSTTQPSVINLALTLDSNVRSVGLRSTGVAATGLDYSAALNYRGGFPYLGATDRLLQIHCFERYIATTVLTDAGPPVNRTAARSVSYGLFYRPRFSWSKGI